MKMFRLVHPDTGAGPYISQGDIYDGDGQPYELCNIVDTFGTSPEPENDKLLKANIQKAFPNISYVGSIVSSCIFGFTELEQAFKWFGSSGVMKLMHWIGFELIEKDIETIYIGDTQCMAFETSWDETPVLKKWTVDEVDDYGREVRRIRRTK